MENWKTINANSEYQVSSEGRIKSLKNSREKILKTSKDSRGYLVTQLCKDGKRYFYLIHRLVAEAFLPNSDNLPEVNHKDENKENNNVENLEWCDRFYNMNYGTAIQRMSNKLKNHPTKSKIVYKYDLNNNLVKVYPSVRECGREGFDESTISKCCRGEHRNHKGFIWSYAPINNIF